MARSAREIAAALQLEAQKQAAIIVVQKIGITRAWNLPIWWRWTTGLACGISIRRIEAVELEYINPSDR